MVTRLEDCRQLPRYGTRCEVLVYGWVFVAAGDRVLVARWLTRRGALIPRVYYVFNYDTRSPHLDRDLFNNGLIALYYVVVDCGTIYDHILGRYVSEVTRGG